MDNFDYSDLRKLAECYQKKFAKSLTPLEADLVIELKNKLSALQEISDEIVNQVAQLVLFHGPAVNERDEVVFGPIKIELKRANPDIPIELGSVMMGHLGEREDPLLGNQRLMESALERTATEFYQIAHRITHLTKKLPKLESFDCRAIRIVRNNLIEHPESSGITCYSFAYSSDDGPFMKGTRKGGQSQFTDPGFKKNSEEFISRLKKSLEESLR